MTPILLPSEIRLKYDIEADWHLLNTCGYRCDYCFFSAETLGEKLKAYARPPEWEKAFERAGLTWLLHLTGGEPTLYPGFVELCETLTANHYISFNSNLNHDAVLEFAERIDPSRVSFINAGLHPHERLRRKGTGTFLKHAATLIERKFPIFISVVCTPEVLRDVGATIALTAPIGVLPVPKLLRGLYRGKSYPEGYSAAERAAFSDFAERARESDLRTFPNERPSVDIFFDDSHVAGTPLFVGRSCEAGRTFVRIEPDGKVYRCQPKQTNDLGNVLDGTFRPRARASACDSDYC